MKNCNEARNVLQSDSTRNGYRPLIADRMGENCPLSEPIKSQDLQNTARLRTEKKIIKWYQVFKASSFSIFYTSHNYRYVLGFCLLVGNFGRIFNYRIWHMITYYFAWQNTALFPVFQCFIARDSKLSYFDQDAWISLREVVFNGI